MHFNDLIIIIKSYLDSFERSLMFSLKNFTTTGFGLLCLFAIATSPLFALPPSCFLLAVKSKKVLVVEDMKTTRMVIEARLENLGLTIEMAEDGEIGLAKAKSQKYDLIVTDWSMPKMNGVAMAEEIRKFDQLTPIVLQTSTRSVPDDLRKFFLPGEFGIMDKWSNHMEIPEEKLIRMLSTVWKIDLSEK